MTNLFIDESFPLLSHDHRGNPLTWRRPHQISRHPVFINDLDVEDIEQGSLGDCWFLASVATLTAQDDQTPLKDIINVRQSFDYDTGSI